VQTYEVQVTTGNTDLPVKSGLGAVAAVSRT